MNSSAIIGGKMNGKAGWILAGGGIPLALMLGWAYAAGGITNRIEQLEPRTEKIEERQHTADVERAEMRTMFREILRRLDGIEKKLP